MLKFQNTILFQWFSFSDQRILILGAGMSGMAAANTLHEAGYHNFQIIEASGTVGGRIRATDLGGYPVELGAMWIYGKGTNPVYKMAVDFNLTLTESFVDDWTVRDESGTNVTNKADEAYHRFRKALQNFSRYASEVKNTDSADLHVMAGIRHFGWLPQTTVDDVIEAYSLDFETGIHPSSLSGFNLVLEETFEDFGSHEMMAAIDTRGFSHIVKELCNRLLEVDNAKLVLNEKVEKIFHSDTNVSVVTESGKVYSGDHVIVTFSLGVLQQRDVTFYPELPRSKQMAINKFGISAYSHIYVQYPYCFWDNSMYILFASKHRGKFSFWQNLNAIMPGCNILQLSLFADDSRWAERSPEEEVVKEIQNVLQTMYPNISIPSPTECKISRWNFDSLTHGAFSYWPATFTNEEMAQLRSPIGRVYFAGEHLHPVHYGFAHGAYLTGVEAANIIINNANRHRRCSSGSAECGYCGPRNASFIISKPTLLRQTFSLFLVSISFVCFYQTF